MSYSTSDLAAAARTTTRGIHIWAKKGLFGEVGRDENGARVFTEDDLERAKVIAAAQMAGMSLGEIRGAGPEELRRNIIDAISFMQVSYPIGFDL